MEMSLYTSPNLKTPQIIWVNLPGEIFNGGGSITHDEAVDLIETLRLTTNLDWVFNPEEGEISTRVPLTGVEDRVRSFLAIAALIKSRYSLTHEFK